MSRDNEKKLPDNIPTWEEFKEMAELFLKNGMNLEVKVDKDDVERLKQANKQTSQQDEKYGE